MQVLTSLNRRVRLLDVEPDLGQFLTEEERSEARALALPVVRLLKGEREIAPDEADAQAFGALVLDGMLLQRLRLDGQETMRLIGPGDLLALEEPRFSTLLSVAGRSAIADTRLAIFGSDFLAASRRWPGLIAGFHARTTEQAERITAQLAICQLPRVADRLLAMMWLLAESWGRVTPAGVTLPLVLTHEALGALIGARRPTVSLAITELVDRGAIVRQQTGWLLLEALGDAGESDGHADAPILVEADESSWRPASLPATPSSLGPELLATVQRLREEFRESRAHVESMLDEIRRGRERRDRERLERAERAANRPKAPSSG